MSNQENIDQLLRDWPYDPHQVLARRVQGEDGRDLLQMRLEMGVLQMEVTGRPDGEKPNGAETYYHYLETEVAAGGEDFILDEQQCEEVDREFVQYYHRRVCWLALDEYRNAQQDAEHTLALMDMVSRHAPDEQWALAHEQYRPFVMFHRVQAAALADLEDNGPEAAIDTIDAGVQRFEDLYSSIDAVDRIEDDELVDRLMKLRDSLRNEYKVGDTLAQRLSAAIAAEEYELAAQLRDEISRRSDQH